MRKRMIMQGLLALLAGLTLPVAMAQTTRAPKDNPKGKPKSTRAKNRKPPQDKGPGETRTERDSRLQRECWGRPNAGACEGYAN